MTWSGKAATPGNGVLEGQRGTEGFRVREKQGEEYRKRFLRKNEQQMHGMVSGKERTVSAKNGILDMLDSDYRKC
jgi:hypothetical protein